MSIDALHTLVIIITLLLIKTIKEGGYSEPPSFSSFGRGFLFGTGRRGSFDRLIVEILLLLLLLYYCYCYCYCYCYYYYLILSCCDDEENGLNKNRRDGYPYIPIHSISI